jgi:hypothetical protein
MDDRKSAIFSSHLNLIKFSQDKKKVKYTFNVGFFVSIYWADFQEIQRWKPSVSFLFSFKCPRPKFISKLIRLEFRRSSKKS